MYYTVCNFHSLKHYGIKYTSRLNPNKGILLCYIITLGYFIKSNHFTLMTSSIKNIILNTAQQHYVKCRQNHETYTIVITGSIFSYMLRYSVGFGLVEMDILTNPKHTLYHNQVIMTLENRVLL